MHDLEFAYAPAVSWTVTTVAPCAAPGTFSGSSPVNGTSLDPTTAVTLVWGASAGANAYDVKFGETNPPPFLKTVTGLSTSVSVVPGKKYYAYVTSYPSCDSTKQTSTPVWSFTVKPIPVPRVIYPNGGESLQGGQAITAQWSVLNQITGGVELQYTTDNGVTWTPFATNVTGTSRSWTLPSITSSQVRLKVIAYDVAGTPYTDQSDGVFTITTCTAPGAFSGSGPVNGTSLDPTTAMTLVWGASAGANAYDVKFGETNPPPFLKTVTGLSTSVSVMPGKKYYAYVTSYPSCDSTKQTSTPVWSFTVKAIPVPRVIYPNGGESLQGGQTITAQWSVLNQITGGVELQYTTDNGVTWTPFATNVTGTSRSWTLPSITSSQVRLKVIAYDVAGTPYTDQSDAVFTITTCAAPGTFSGSSPVNGTSLDPTTAVTLVWGASAGASAYDVKFGETNPPPFLKTVTGLSTSVSVVPGKTYFVYVTAYPTCDSTKQTSTSVWSFTVKAIPVPHVIFPNGGESLLAGQTITVQWSVLNQITAGVELQYTTDNGLTWTPLATNVTGTSRNWTLPHVKSNQVRIKVITYGVSGTAYTDQSDATFTIDSIPGNRIDGLASRDSDGATTPVFIKRIDSSDPISSNAQTTWIVIHGRDSDSDARGIINSLAQAVAGARHGEQVLVLDWRYGANAASWGDFRGQEWIAPVGEWAAGALYSAGIRGSGLNLWGHSWGSYVASELAQHMPFGSIQGPPYRVKSIVALDPAAAVPLVFGFDHYNTDLNNFASVSGCSWAFYSSAFGNEKTAITALETTAVRYTNGVGDHSLPVVLLTAMLNAPTETVPERFQLSGRFQLDRLLNCAAGPWLPNRLTSTDVRNSDGKYEAFIQASDDGQPVAIDFDAPDNVALANNGGIATASQPFFGIAPVPPIGAIDGDRVGDGWVDGTLGQWPDWLQVTFAGPKTIAEVDVFSVQDSNQPRRLPTPTMTFGTPTSTFSSGLTDFQVQYLSGAQWINVPNGSVSGNNKVWRQITFPPLITTAIRVYITKAFGFASPLVEVEAYSAKTGAAPAAFGKTVPATGATGATLTQVLGWESSLGATNYEYCLDTIDNSKCDGIWTSTSSAASVTLGNLGLGTTYFWQVRSINSSGATYADGGSSAYWSFTTAALPDLTESSITNPPVTVIAGASFSVTDTTTNQGSGTAGASTTRYRLSTDSTITSADALLTGIRSVPSLAAGGTSSGSVTVTIPPDAAPGIYYLGACADDLGAVTEGSETNNCRASAATVGVTSALPDLTESSITNPPVTVIAGASFSVTDTTTNQGSGTAGASTTRYRLSTDSTITSADALLTGTRSVPSLAAGGTSSGSVTVTIPPDAAPGIYYLGACADDLGAVTEGSETNNCRASAATVSVTSALPDLTESSITNPPVTVIAGASFSVTDTTTNQGSGTAGASTTRYRLSTDTTITAADLLLTGTRSVPSLAANGTSSGSVTVTIPVDMPPGTYYVGACADDLGAVIEGNETNNCRASTTTVSVSPLSLTPDFVVIAMTAPTSGTVGGSLAGMSATIKNQGTLAAGAYRLGFYFSTSSTYNSSAIFSGTVCSFGSGLAAGTTQICTGTVSVPSSLSPGSYYLIAFADDQFQVSESSETNNWLSATTGVITLTNAIGQPDLLMTAMTAPTSGTVGGSLAGMSATIKNQGTSAAGPYRLGFYFSTSSTYNSSAVFSGTVCSFGSGLAAGTTQMCTGTVSVPSSLSPGSYYLIAFADDQFQVSESSETNNWLAASSGVITLTGVTGQADLLVTSLTAPTSGTVGGSLAGMSVTVKNQGTSAAGPYRLGFYYSTSSTYNSSAVFSGTVCSFGSGIAAGATQTCTGAISIPPSLSKGGYYLIAYADDQTQIPESNETNNWLVATSGVITLR